MRSSILLRNRKNFSKQKNISSNICGKETRTLDKMKNTLILRFCNYITNFMNYLINVKRFLIILKNEKKKNKNVLKNNYVNLQSYRKLSMLLN